MILRNRACQGIQIGKEVSAREATSAQSAGILALAEQMKAINAKLEKMEQEPPQEENTPHHHRPPLAPEVIPKKKRAMDS